jgi:threonine dehydrogenase-like Zn-dependent dehydrogenase
MTALVEGFESGKLQAPAIAQTFTLDQAREAYQAVAGGTPGRVVITMQ